MAMTSAVKAELARIEVTKPCCRKAEAASMLRFALQCCDARQGLAKRLPRARPAG